jgi:hypothetical protein
MWTRVAFSWDGSYWRLYLNGRLDTQIQTTLVPHDSSNPVMLGHHNHISIPHYFNGRMDEVRFSSFARTSDMMQFTSLAMFAGFSILGTVGANYDIQVSNDIGDPKNWTTVTNLTLQSSPFFFLDSESPNFRERFYRAILVP